MTATDGSLADMRGEAIRVLTAAARHSDADGRPLDFADFLAYVLVATAANVGGPERLLAGRPGSWEAGYVDAVLRGTVGDDPDAWAPRRTEPLVIPLNVAELIERGDRHPGLLGLEEAIAEVGRGDEGGDHSNDEAWDAEIDGLITRYTEEYDSYVVRFTTAAEAINKERGLTAGIKVVTDPDPANAWWGDAVAVNPDPFSSDRLTLAIWTAAHQAVALPNVEIRFVPPSRPATERSLS